MSGKVLIIDTSTLTYLYIGAGGTRTDPGKAIEAWNRLFQLYDKVIVTPDPEGIGS